MFSKITLQDNFHPEVDAELYHLFALLSSRNDGKTVEERPFRAVKRW
jgi:hypothetical protein